MLRESLWKQKENLGLENLLVKNLNPYIPKTVLIEMNDTCIRETLLHNV